MKNWRKFGQAALAAGVLAFGSQRVEAACIDTLTNTVSNPADCLFAKGGTTGTCRLAVSIDMSGTGTPPADPKKISCVDGDPACDSDGSVNGSCTFRVGACVNLPGCDTDNVSAGTVSKPGAKDANNAIKTPSAVYNRYALQDAFTALLPNSGAGKCTSANVPVKVDLKPKGGVCNPDSGLPNAGAKCTSDQECDDYCVPNPMGSNKTNVAFAVTDSGKGASAKFKLTCLPATGAFANGAQAFQISNPADLIGGPLAMGRVGDYEIRNGNIRAILRAPGRQHSFTLLNGGQIIDADLARTDGSADRDSWQGMQPLVNISSSQATDTVTVENDGADGKPAIIHTSGPDDLFDVIKGDILVLGAGLTVPEAAIDHDLPISLSTDFILNPYSNMIQIATTVQNNSGSQLNYFMGDFLNPSGQLEPFGPGQGYGESVLRNGANSGGAQGLDYLAFQGRLDASGVTYGVVFPGTTPIQRTDLTGAFSSSGVYAWVTRTNLFTTLFNTPATKPVGDFVIPGNGSKTLRRWFVVGKTVADVSRAHQDVFVEEKSAVQGVVTVGGAPVAGAHVTLSNSHIGSGCDDSHNCANIYSSTLTDKDGFYRMYAPEGAYNIAVRATGAPYQGLAAEPTQLPVILTAKKTSVLDVPLPGTGTIVVNVVDQDGNPIAGKVSVVGVAASPDPMNDEYANGSLPFTGRYFGYDFEEKGEIFGLASYRFADASGTTGSFNLEPGTYHVVVSHGYEYDAYDEMITLTDGSTSTVNATVHHVVDTTGFVSIDTHVHMINSPDSTISRQRRITSMLAEGVDFFVNTDHDFVHSLADEISDMGVGTKIGNAPSVETTTSHYGHFNIWPVVVDPLQVDGGAYDWSFHSGDLNGKGYPNNADGSHAYDRTPAEIFGLANPATQVIQINHFNSGTLGCFNMLGIDTKQNPPVSSNKIYRCVGGTKFGLPCRVPICIGGANDSNTCSGPGDCPGGSCAAGTSCDGGGTCTPGGTLASYLRMDPAATNLYGDNYTALEIWIEAGRAQTDLLRGENMGDWFNLLNQGRYKAGTSDSDSHSAISVQAGGPRTFVASTTDAPGSIDANAIALNVNAMRAIGSNGPFMRVQLENGSAQIASQDLSHPQTIVSTAGPLANSINLHIEAPTWAQYDKIDIYMNSVTSCSSQWTFFGVVNPSSCGIVTPSITLTKGVDFTVATVPGYLGSGSRLVTDKSIPVTISADTWVVVVARGTDGVSKPLFPIEPQDLSTTGNNTEADLTDNNGPLPWNLGEQGTMALVYSNPLFFDANSDGFCNGGAACP